MMFEVFVLHDSVGSERITSTISATHCSHATAHLLTQDELLSEAGCTADEALLALTKRYGISAYDLPRIVVQTGSRARFIPPLAHQFLHFATTQAKVSEDLAMVFELLRTLDFGTLHTELIRARALGAGEFYASSEITQFLAQPVIVGASYRPMGFYGMFQKLKEVFKDQTPEWPWQISREELQLEARASLLTALRLHSLNLPSLAPVITSYCQAVEAEFNASIVQDIRRNLGVSMPEHYLRHASGLRAMVEENGMRLDLNSRAKDGSWLPTGLGQSYHAARIMNLPQIMERDKLMRIWDQLREVRNKATHVNTLPTKLELVESRQFVDDLLNSSIGKELLRLKRGLQGTS